MKTYNLHIEQPEEGYRYSVDSVLLAEFASLKARARVLELGAGCGVISLILGRRFPACNIHAVEIQDELFRFLEKNIETHGLSQRIFPVHHDIRQIRRLFPAGSFEHVVTNPPFRPPVSGRLCLDAQEALARHEILIDLEGIIDAAAWVLKPGGRFSIIYPAERLSFLLGSMTRKRIEPKRLRCVHPSEKTQARMVLVEGVRDAGIELRIEPPLFLNSRDKSGLAIVEDRC